MSHQVVQYIARQAILDRNKSLFAYELLYRDSNNNAFPVGTSDELATGRMFFNSLMLIGRKALVGQHTAFINLSDSTLLEEIPKLITPDHLVLEIVERSQNIEELREIVAKLKKLKYRFALDDYDADPRWDPILADMEYIKLELEQPIIKTKLMIKKLKRSYPKLKIVVERIETYDEFEMVKEAGADYFQGFFFAKPEMLEHGNLEPAKTVVFELMRASMAPELCFNDIQQRIAKDASLTARILKLVNCMAKHTKSDIKSISQAVVFLGEDTLRQFIRVLALSDLGTEKPKELTKLGLTRARFMWLFFHSASAEMAEEAYLVGLLSIFGAVLNQELSAVVNEFSLESSLSDALLNQQGMLGTGLKMALSLEQNEVTLASEHLAQISPAKHISSVLELYTEGRMYADEVIEGLI